MSEYAVTEEDVLEFMHALQSEERKPDKLYGGCSKATCSSSAATSPTGRLESAGGARGRHLRPYLVQGAVEVAVAREDQGAEAQGRQVQGRRAPVK
jgi:hypothetical protein